MSKPSQQVEIISVGQAGRSINNVIPEIFDRRGVNEGMVASLSFTYDKGNVRDGIMVNDLLPLNNPSEYIKDLKGN